MNGPSLFIQKKFYAIKGPEFYALDEMHLVYHGLGHLYLNLINSKFDLNSNISPFAIDDIDEIMTSMRQSRQNIPTAFNGNWQTVLSGIVRAVDWQDFLLLVVPTLIVPRLKTKKAQEATMALVRACQKLLTYELTRIDVENIEM